MYITRWRGMQDTPSVAGALIATVTVSVAAASSAVAAAATAIPGAPAPKQSGSWRGCLR